MADDKTVRIVLQVVDQASAVTQQVRDSLSRLGTTSDKVAASTASIASVAASGVPVLTRLSESAKGLDSSLSPIADQLAKATDRINLAGSASANASKSIAAFGQLASGAAPAVSSFAAGLKDLQLNADAATSFRELASAVGVSVATLEELGAVARQNGVTVEELGNGFATLAEKINEAQRPGSQAAKDFELLGINVRQLSESQRTIGGILPLVSSGLDKLESSAGRAHVATALLGQDGAKVGQILQKFSTQADANKFSSFASVLKLAGIGLDDVSKAGSKGISTLEAVRQVVSSNTLLFAGFAASIAAVPASLALLTHGAITLGDALNNMAQSTGVSVEFLSSFDLLARQNNTSLQEIGIGFRTLAKAIVEAQDETSEAAKTFRALGIDMRSLSADQKTIEAVIPRVADGLSRLKDGAGKTSIAISLLGRSGEQLIPVFNEGASGLEAARKKAQELELQFSGGTAAAMDRFGDRLTELGGIFRGLGNQIAAKLVEPLTSFINLALEHSTAIKVGFLGIAAGITAIGAAITVVKVGGFIDALLAAIAGPAALAGVTSLTGLMLALKEGILGLLAPLGATATAMNGAFGLAIVARIGLVGAALAGATAIVISGIEAWKLYRDRKAEALATKGLEDQNTALKSRTSILIGQFQEEGRITDQQAKILQDKLDSAFSQRLTRKVPVNTGFGGQVTFDTVKDVRDTAGEATAIKDVNKALRETLDLQTGIGQQSKAATQAGQEFAKTQLAVLQSQLEIERSNTDLQISAIKAVQDAPGSSVKVADSVEQRRQVLDQLDALERTFIQKRAQLEETEARKAISNDPRFADRKNQSDVQVQIERESADAVKIVRQKANEDLQKLDQKSAQARIALLQELSQGEIDESKRSTQLQIDAAKSRFDELKASELQFNLDVIEIAEQRGLTIDQREDALATKRRERQERDLQAEERISARKIELNDAINASQLALAQSDPGPNTVERQERINQLLRERNDLLRQQIQLNQATLIKEGDPEKRLELQKKTLELQQQIIQNNRTANLQGPTNLPQFQSSLGFQNKLDHQGNKIVNPDGSTAREMIAPFKALDDFLTGTLQTTFNGLSGAITGLITGATTWAQAWQQAGNQIIGMVVQLILEYTIFHQIRTALDSIFHATARTNIAGTAAAGQAAQAGAAATGAASAGVVAAAGAPAAAATSIWSFGSSAAIGLAISLAAIAAIVAALAFKRGGMVPKNPIAAYARGGITPGIFRGPGGPTEDKILTSALPGTGILTADAVNHWGGSKFVADLLARRLPTPWTAGTGNTSEAMPTSTWSPPSGAAVPIRVSPGEAGIDPQTVAFYGGPKFIELLNQKRLPAGIFSPKIANQIGTVANRFASGGMVKGSNVARSFASGGTITTNGLRQVLSTDRSLHHLVERDRESKTFVVPHVIQVAVTLGRQGWPGQAIMAQRESTRQRMGYILGPNQQFVMSPGTAGEPAVAQNAVAGLVSSSLPRFESGGIVQGGPRIDVSNLAISNDAMENFINVSAGRSVRAAAISEALQGKFNQQAPAKIPTPEIYVVKRDEELFDVLRKPRGRAFMLDLLSGMKTELGIPS